MVNNTVSYNELKFGNLFKVLYKKIYFYLHF